MHWGGQLRCRDLSGFRHTYAGIAHAQGGPAVNEDVRRTADGRSGDGVRAAILAVAVGGAKGFVAYAAGWGHGGAPLCFIFIDIYNYSIL